MVGQLARGTDAEVPLALSPPVEKQRPLPPLSCLLSPHFSSQPNSAVLINWDDAKLPADPYSRTLDQTRGRLTRVSGLRLSPPPLGLAPRLIRSHAFLAVKAPLTSFTERNSSNGKTRCRSKKCAMRVVKSYSAILSSKKGVCPLKLY